MTAIRLFFVLTTVLATSLVAVGCYTMLKHPTVDPALSEETQDDRCTSCHYEDEVWGFHHPSVQRPYPLGGYDAWGFYYTVPWWYDSYWYYDAPPEAHPVPLPGRNLRPDIEKGSVTGATGGPVGPLPDTKSTGTSVRVKKSDDTGKGKVDDKDDLRRGTRPKSGKEKEKKGNDEKEGG